MLIHIAYKIELKFTINVFFLPKLVKVVKLLILFRSINVHRSFLKCESLLSMIRRLYESCAIMYIYLSLSLFHRRSLVIVKDRRSVRIIERRSLLQFNPRNGISKSLNVLKRLYYFPLSIYLLRSSENRKLTSDIFQIYPVENKIFGCWMLMSKPLPFLAHLFFLLFSFSFCLLFFFPFSSSLLFSYFSHLKFDFYLIEQ